MSKPTSSVSTAISIRIPNDILQSVVDYALSQGFINESGRTDKRGQPNLSAAIADLLKKALSPSNPAANLPDKLYDSVGNLKNQNLESSITAIEDRLTTKLCAAITQQLNVLLAHSGAVETGKALFSLHPAEQAIAEAEPPAIEKEDTRQRILNAASRGFRSRGYAGIGIDALVKEAGVTSGAFYGYFRSKEEAFLTAAVAGLDEYRSTIEAFRANHGTNWTVALADYYMGRQHRANLASGCALATLSPEVMRSGQRVRVAYQTELVKLNGAIAAGFTTGTEIEKQNHAWILLALLAGGVTLARAVWDENLSDQISRAIHQAAIASPHGQVQAACCAADNPTHSAERPTDATRLSTLKEFPHT